MLFWAISFLTAAAVALLLGRAFGQGTGASGAALAVYRDQLTEIDRDLARGTLSEAEAERVRLEVQRRLLDADRAARAAPGPARGPGRGAALAVGGVVIALALGGYAWIGAPETADQPLQGRLLAAAAKKDSRPSQVRAEAVFGKPFAPAPDADPAFLALVERLRAAVAERPDDVEGLNLLTRNETAIGNFKGAYAAQARLIAVLGDRAGSGDHAQLAGLMVLAAGGFVSPEAELALVKALTMDKREPRARYLTGLLFAQNDRPDLAFRVWQPLLAESNPDAPWVGPIRAGIEEVAALAGLRYELPPVKGPSAADIAAAAEMSEADRAELIGGMVEGLSERLATEGGPAPDWARLIRSLGVLGQTDRARAIWNEAQQVFAGEPEGLAEIRAAATAAGVVE